MRYRERFHLSWDEFINTPWEVMVQDLEILDIEAAVLQSKEETTDASAQ